MTPAESAVNNAISFECKKDALQQRQSGDWKISFTVQGIDMDDRITKAPMGTRFVAVLVAINDDELPITQTAKEKAKPETVSPKPSLPEGRPSEKAKRDWRDMKPSAQAAIRCAEPIFWAYLNEEHGYGVGNKDDAAEAVRDKCGVASRKFLDDHSLHAARMIWHQLDSGYVAWKALEHA
jgi:hypothetical protein